MTHDEAAEILRLQLVALTGLDDARIDHGPVDAPRQVQGWVGLIPLAETPQGHGTRRGTVLEQAYDASFVMTAYGSEAVTAMKGALAELPTDTPNATMALDQGVTLRQAPSARPSAFVSTVIRTANEPRQSATLVIGYVFTRAVATPPVVSQVIVDLLTDPLGDFEPAFTVEVSI